MVVVSPILVSSPPSADHAQAKGVFAITDSSDFVVITATGMRLLILLSAVATSWGTCDLLRGTLIGLMVPS